MPRYLASCVLLFVLAGCREKAPPKAPPAPVVVAAVERHDVPLQLQATGTVEPEQTVRLQPQVTGTITHVGFREGEQVTKGQLLFELDPRPYEAALSQANALLTRDRSQLNNSRLVLARNEELAAKQYITKEQLGDSRTEVAGLEATVSADSAAAEQARLSLEYSRIRAPISGRAGGLLVKEGNLVRSNTADPLVVINQLKPILVRFSFPVAQLGSLKALTVSQPTVEVTPAGGTPRPGKVVFVDNAVDTTTGTVQLKARLPNDDEALWPGQYVTVEMRLSTDKGVLVVPSTAVVAGQDGSYVFLLKADSTVTTKPVKVARTTGRDAIISEGVAEGDVVVTDGQIRLREGARVTVAGPKTTTLGAEKPAP